MDVADTLFGLLPKVPTAKAIAPCTDLSADVNCVADDFSDRTTYSDNDGSVNWTSSWTEINDDGESDYFDAANQLGIGISGARVVNFLKSNVELRRSVDLQNTGTATLRFQSGDPGSSGHTLPISNMTNNQELYVEIYNGTTWNLVHTVTNSNLGDIGPLDIHSYINLSGDTQLRFRTNTHSDWAGSFPSNGVYIDNVEIDFTEAVATEPVPFGTLTGFVFQDYDADGIRDSGEPGLENVTVSVSSSFTDTTHLLTATTDINGSYSMTSTTFTDNARVFFTLPAALSALQPTVYGAHNGTSAQFVTFNNDKATASAGYSAIQSSGACDTSGALIAVACYESGIGSTSTGPGFVSFPHTASGVYPGSGTAPSMDAQIQDIGTVWGTAYEPSTKRLYTATFIKRHAGLGPLAPFDGTNYTPDGVYIFDYSSGTSGSFDSANPGFTLHGVSGVDLGTIRRQPDTNNRLDNDYELLTDPTKDSVDLDAFDKVGKIGFGDIDVDETGNNLWLVNLNEQNLIQVVLNDAGNPVPTNGSAAPAAIVTEHNITGPACSNSEFLPWGLKFYGGKGYVGGVCTAETSQNTDDIVAYVLSFDPDNVAGGFTTEVSFDLDYNREKANPFTTGIWHPWTRNWNDTGFGTNVGGEQPYPQPILSDIEFTDNGSMVLGFIDRWGHQIGYFNVRPLSSAWNYRSITANAAGDTIHICTDGSGGWIVEGNAGCAVNDQAGVTSTSLSNDGPSNNGEFYYQDDYFQFSTGFYHNEVTTGGLAILPGTEEVAVTAYDPRRNTSSAFTQGIRWFHTTDGHQTRWYDFVPSSTEYFGKASGLGDLEVIVPSCDVATPVEVGNRVWSDYNGNGIQDAGEPGIAGVTVQLLDGSDAVIATAVTDLSGEYYFSSQQGTDSSSAKYGLAIEFDTTGVYKIQIPNATGGSQQSPILDYTMSTPNQGSNDLLDSDATFNGTNARITIDTTANNHTYDIGFIPYFDLALRKVSNVQYVAASDDATFSIEIFNQGQGPVDNIQIIDYIPANLSLNDGDWTPSSGNATITLNSGDELPNGGLGAGGSVNVDITLQAGGGLSSGLVITNTAEIYSMTNLTGTVVSDSDSTPDTTNSDLMTDNVIDNSNGDEDDHDIAIVTVQNVDVYDLALRKQLADGQSSRVSPGEDVVFNIEVFNQGTQNSGNGVIDLIDRYPTGFSLSANDTNGWVDQGNNTATTTLSGNLTAGSSTVISIVLTAGSTLGDLQNFAEILDDHGSRDDVDSDPENEDGNGNGDNLIDDIIDQDAATDEDDHDVAAITVFRYDLALTKQLAAGEPSTVGQNSDVTFVIEVTNQGSVDAYDIVVADYIPTGFSLSDNDGNGWSVISDTQVINSIPGPLGATGSPTNTGQLSITLRVAPTATLGTLTNYAEIVSGAETPGGPTITDLDSTPDSDPSNDLFTTDNDISSDGKNGGDEDDHDPASVTVGEFDLALFKVYTSDSSSDGNDTDGIIQVGDQVTFTINIVNQGTVDAYDIAIVDYIPDGFYMDDSSNEINIDKGWEADTALVGGVYKPASRNVLPGPIAAGGGTASIDIVLVVAGPSSFVYTGDPVGTHDNWAEIYAASDRTGGNNIVDDDSTPDSNRSNDTFGADNEINNGSSDEDDHDRAQVTVQTGFDLALIKYIDSSALNEVLDPKVISVGDNITYTIIVENQGLIASQSITVVDYIPTGFTLNDGNWADGGTTATRAFNNVNLAAGDRMTTTIVLQVSAAVTPSQTYTNYAEIASATDDLGGASVDLDSDADTNVGNDVFVTDNSLTGLGTRSVGADEDDHDIAVVQIAPAVAIGNIVWHDNGLGSSGSSGFNNGIADGTEPGIDGVLVELYAGTVTTGTRIMTDTTSGGGFYLFDMLAEGDYTVHIPASQFANGAVLDNYTNSTGAGGDGTNDDNADENGLDALVNGGVSSALLSLVADDEPTIESGRGSYTGILDDNHVNMTIDFGFYETEPTLEISKLLNTPEPVLPNHTVSFTIQITNTEAYTLVTIPLTDTYDNTYLAYQSANVDPASADDDGQLNWGDLTASAPNGFNMDLGPGQSFSVVVNFQALVDTTALPNSSTENQAVVYSYTATDRVQIFNPTNVVISAKDVQVQDAQVMLYWTTAAETDMIGFNVWRVDGDARTQLNSELIIANYTGQAIGDQYTLVDESFAQGLDTDGSYDYVVEIVMMGNRVVEQSLGTVRVVDGEVVSGYQVYLPVLMK
ncbi:MAG: SdrD B-like domain-containing protein [Chloroflexota bacterium]